MGIFAELLEEQRNTAVRESRASLDNPAVPLSLASFLGWLGGGEPTASGEVINVASALQISDVYACARVITEAVGSLSMGVFEVHPNGAREKVDHDLNWILAVEPNDEMSAPTVWEAYSGAMALAGNGYAEILRDGAGRSAGLYPLNPGITSPHRDARTGQLVYRTTSGMDSGRDRIIAAENIVHCPLFSLDGIKGLSPITMARQMLGLAKAAEKFGAKFFGNGAYPGGLLTPETGSATAEQKANLKESWERNYGGDNARRVAVLNSQWKWQAIGLSPEDSQFLGTQQYTRTRIAALFRISPHMIGDTTRLSGTNAGELNLDFMVNTLRPYLNRIEKELNRKLLPRVGRKAYKLEIRYDVSERMRGDFATTMNGIAVARQWGLFTINDGRRQLGLNPIGAEGDVCMVPVNMQAAERLLDTEPIADQPLDPSTDPPALPAPKKSAAEEDDDLDTEPQRTALGRYAVQFGMPFAEALRSAGGDIDALNLRTLLGGIADRAAQEHPFTAWPDGVVEKVAADAHQGVLRRLQRRGLPVDPAPAYCRDEFRRAVRSIHIQIARECGAIEAEREVNQEES